MVQNKTKLDKLILESQDFPEVAVKKGADCFREELYYLLRTTLLGVEKNTCISSCDYTYRYSDKPQIILGKREGGILLPASITRYVTIKTTDENEQQIINDDSKIHPIKIKVHDERFLEPAKLFAKTYKKWCGQEATVTKEYNSTEEKAKTIINLENLIEETKINGNINELEEIPKTDNINDGKIQNKIDKKITNRKEKEEATLKNLTRKLENSIRPKLEWGFYFGKLNNSKSCYIDWECGEIVVPLAIYTTEMIFKKKLAYRISIKCKEDTLLSSINVTSIKLGYPNQYFESGRTLANKLRELFDSDVEEVLVAANYLID